MSYAARTASLLILVGLLLCSSAQAMDAQGGPEHAEAPTHDEDEEVEEVIVQATRAGRRVQDEPIRVEVLNREEIEEKLLMRPGNIAMLVSETGGVRVQVTSPSLGAANIRVQGMSGRYTQLLADGLPLYGGQTASLGLLQIPPTDLGQVEVIKGAASALYGPAALGGVINLVSRRPGDEMERELLVNVTSRDGQDITGYLADEIGAGWSYSLMGGLHHQNEADLGHDAWIDMPGYERWATRPRLFWENEHGAAVYTTFGATHEQREGGTLQGRTLPDGQTFPERQDTERYDAGVVAELPNDEWGTLHVRASGMSQAHDHRFGAIVEEDRHETAFIEAAWSEKLERAAVLAGVAYQVDRYHSTTFPAFDYQHRSPALFAQIEYDLRNDLTLAASGRVDHHSEYDTQFSPRFSALYRPGDWTLRASLGRGFYAPTPFIEDVEALGLSRLQPLSGLDEETATTASLDVGHRLGNWESNLTLFASDMEDAVRLAPAMSDAGAEQRVRVINVEGATRVRGAELLLRYRKNDFTVTGSYVLTDATEPELTGERAEVPLTPRHTAGFVAMWESHGKGRVGFEAYYTGTQRLDDNPYRSRSPSYVELGLLGEIVLGNVRWFLNAENLLHVRQTRHDPLLRPQRAPDGRYTVDVWAPTDGFIVNGGFRLQF